MRQNSKILAQLEHGRRKSHTFKLTTAILARFSVPRKARYNALRRLEKLGLVTVERNPGKNPVVTIIL
jgi:DNA-binding MarR family transcriptional regulator